MQRCSLQADRVLQPLAGLYEGVTQSDSWVAAGGVSLVLDGGYDLAGGRIAPLPHAGTAGALAEYASAREFQISFAPKFAVANPADGGSGDLAELGHPANLDPLHDEDVPLMVETRAMRADELAGSEGVARLR